jgi:hypothetical protein
MKKVKIKSGRIAPTPFSPPNVIRLCMEDGFRWVLRVVFPGDGADNIVAVSNKRSHIDSLCRDVEAVVKNDYPDSSPDPTVFVQSAEEAWRDVTSGNNGPWVMWLCAHLFSIVGGYKGERNIVQHMSHLLVNSHRTVQQSMIRAISVIIFRYANDRLRIGTDARNQAAMDWAGKVAKIELNMPYV